MERHNPSFELTRTTSGAVVDVRTFEKYPPCRIAVVALAVNGELEYELAVFAVTVVAVSRGHKCISTSVWMM